MKKFISIILSLVLVLSLAAVASAASITITNPANVEDEIYTAYKVFDATISTDADGKEHVSYTIDSVNNPFFAAVQDSGYFTLAPINNGTIYNVTKNDNYNGAAAATLAATLAEVDGKTPAGTATWDAESKTYKIENLSTGYYIVTSSVGSAIIVDTLKDESITSKNTYPSLTKTADKTTAAFGETVTYTVTVTIPETANGAITVHDTMTDLSYTAGSASAKVVVDGTDISVNISENTAPAANHCTVEFTLSADVVAANKGKNVIITYAATVDANKTTANNSAYLTYSHFTSTPVATTVNNYYVDVYKYTGEGDAKTGLAGAGFVLKNADGKYYKNTNGIVSWVDTEGEATEYTTAATTYTITFAGLANGTYTLVEKTVPAGYNKANDQTITIADANMTGETQIGVLNSTGSELPSTGGIGTTIFYVVGCLLMTGAVVLLVTKRRMGNA